MKKQLAGLVIMLLAIASSPIGSKKGWGTIGLVFVIFLVMVATVSGRGATQ